MKHSIHNDTIDFLGKHKDDEMVNYFSGADELEIIIFEQGLRIKHVYIDKELDLIALVLNNKKIIKRKVSEFPQLTTASNHDLVLVENDGIGIHWPQLDFDLSLKGFLRYELAYIDKPFSA